MYTIEELKSIIHPVPQKVTAGKGEALKQQDRTVRPRV